MSAVVEDSLVVLRFEEWMLTELARLMKSVHAESYKALDFEESHVENALGTAIHTDGIFGAAYVDMTDREILGLIIAHVDQTMWSREPVVKIVLCYVEPEARTPAATAALRSACHRWAKKAGVRHVVESDPMRITKLEDPK